MIGLRLTRLEFNRLENIEAHARSVEEVGIFVDDPEYDQDGVPVDLHEARRKTAVQKIHDWLSQQQPVRLYMGWNHEVYPQYKVEEVVIT